MGSSAIRPDRPQESASLYSDANPGSASDAPFNESGCGDVTVPMAESVKSGPDVIVPLSFAQQRMWVLDRLDGGAGTYNLGIALRLLGRVNQDALQRALSALAARHSVLRSTFVENDGRPVQVVREGGDVEFVTIECRSEEVLREGAAALVRRPFDMAAQPPFRCGLLRVNPREAVLVLAFHHILVDRWSIGILLNELAVLYRAEAVGQAANLAPVSFQYATYAEAQRAESGSGGAEAAEFWSRHLPVGRRQLRLPAPTRPSAAGGAALEFVLPEPLASAGRDLARRHGASVFMEMVAALVAAMHVELGVEEVIVGVETSGRTRVEHERVVGFFVNILPLRFVIASTSSFLDVLATVRDVTLEALEHQCVPFDAIVSATRAPRRYGTMPLVDVVCGHQQDLGDPPSWPDLGATWFALDDHWSRLSFALLVYEMGAVLTYAFVHDRCLVSAPWVEQLASTYLRVLQLAASEPHRPIRTGIPRPRKEYVMTSEESPGSRSLPTIGTRPAPTRVAVDSLVRKSTLSGDHELPLLIKPETDLEAPAWVEMNKSDLHSELDRYGAVLLRGFTVRSAEHFEQIARAATSELLDDYGDLPREQEASATYRSTPYPASRTIGFHNESSHMPWWPLRQLFCCQVAAESGGETPIADCRRVLANLEPSTRCAFATKGLLYIRNFIEGYDVTWQEFFHTHDRSEAEAICARQGLECEWLPSGGLRTKSHCPAIVRHPRTGDVVFFNQIQAHHVLCLDDDLRQSLLSLVSLEDLPRHVYFGDGSEIEEDVIAEIAEAYERQAVRFPWQEGDVLLLDNMLVAHSRAPYTGDRRVLVALGDRVTVTTVETPSPAELA